MKTCTEGDPGPHSAFVVEESSALLPHSFPKLRLLDFCFLFFCQHLICVPQVVHKRILGGIQINIFILVVVYVIIMYKYD